MDPILYLESTIGIIPSQLTGFFVGWPNPPSAEKLLHILEGSAHCVLAYDGSVQRTVGFINCISDGILSAYIPLLEVLPEYQHRGIGTKLMERMLEITSGYYMTDVTCDVRLVSFYERMGLTRSQAMVRRTYEAQSGGE